MNITAMSESLSEQKLICLLRNSDNVNRDISMSVYIHNIF